MKAFLFRAFPFWFHVPKSAAQQHDSRDIGGFTLAHKAELVLPGFIQCTICLQKGTKQKMLREFACIIPIYLQRSYDDVEIKEKQSAVIIHPCCFCRHQHDKCTFSGEIGLLTFSVFTIFVPQSCSHVEKKVLIY